MPIAEVVFHADLILLRLERRKGFAVIRCIRIRDERIAGIEALHVVGVERDVLLRLVDECKGRREDRLIVMRLDRARRRIVGIHLDALLTAAEHELPLVIRRRDRVRQRHARERVLIIFGADQLYGFSGVWKTMFQMFVLRPDATVRLFM